MSPLLAFIFGFLFGGAIMTMVAVAIKESPDA